MANIITHYVPVEEVTGIFDEYTHFSEDENGHVFKMEIDVDLLKSQVQYVRENLLKKYKAGDVSIESVDIKASAILSMEYTVSNDDLSPTLNCNPWIHIDDYDVYCIDLCKWINASVEVNLSNLVTSTDTEE